MKEKFRYLQNSFLQVNDKMSDIMKQTTKLGKVIEGLEMSSTDLNEMVNAFKTL